MDGSWWRVLTKRERNDIPLQYSCFENPMNIIKKQKDRTLKDELPSQWVLNMLLEKSREGSRRNEEAEPKWK